MGLEHYHDDETHHAHEHWPNYEIIKSEFLLEEFIDWLPELEPNEKYYLSLFARKKYCQSLIKSNDKTQLKRFTSSKERMLNKIQQLEIIEGKYLLRGEQIVPQEALVLYINPNPRCMKRATFAMGHKCLKMIENKNEGFNLHAEAMSCIQVSKSRTFVVDFDIDDKSEKTIDMLKGYLPDLVPRSCYKILETRGGFHIMVLPQRVKYCLSTLKNRVVRDRMERWHPNIMKIFNVDQGVDKKGNIVENMIPVPGCVQGGFIPKFVEL